MAQQAVQRRVQATEQLRDRVLQASSITRCRNTVPRVLPQNFEEYGVSFFFNSYMVSTSDANLHTTFANSVYPASLQADSRSPLKPAVAAVALTALETWSGTHPDSPQSLAYGHYARAITALRVRIQNAKAVDDEIFMTMLVLDTYNRIIGFCGGHSVSADHLVGIKVSETCIFFRFAKSA